MGISRVWVGDRMENERTQGDKEIAHDEKRLAMLIVQVAKRGEWIWGEVDDEAYILEANHHPECDDEVYILEQDRQTRS